MASVTKKTGKFTFKAYAGDSKTLLAFNFDDASAAHNLAGFTVQITPKGQPSFYLQNTLTLADPASHAQDASQPANSTLNAPIQKFRWLHVPGSVHQGLKPLTGAYTYTATPRYFDDAGHLTPLDPKLSATLTIDVGPFSKGVIGLGFARGFTQSQAFVHHFGLKALIRPPGHELLFDTSQQAGTNAQGEKHTYAEAYDWLGFTARERIFEILQEVLDDSSLTLDVFAYDLNEPDVCKALLTLGKQGRVRIVLDNAALHHKKDGSTPEDQFEALFAKAAKSPAGIVRGHFSRYSHDKVLIVSNAKGPQKVLTGSTNFSVTGIYVNSNHVVIFDDADIAALYAKVFENAFAGKANTAKFEGTDLSTQVYRFDTPKASFAFSPHDETFAESLLNGMAVRINAEGKVANGMGSVMFAVMELDNGTSPVWEALCALHDEESVFSYGISDNPNGIALYAPGHQTGVLVTGKPSKAVLPPPFDQVPGITMGHQVHHKFVVCGFGRPDAVVYCGSSNLALGGEQANGDNLICIHDTDVATAFAIEALGLVDHFAFLDRFATASNKAAGNKASQKTPAKPMADKTQAAASVGFHLWDDDKWAQRYFAKGDLHNMDRELFG